MAEHTQHRYLKEENKMARRGGFGDGGSLFIGRLSKNTRVRDLEEVFESYGRVTRCDIKYGECCVDSLPFVWV